MEEKRLKLVLLASLLLNLYYSCSIFWTTNTSPQPGWSREASAEAEAAAAIPCSTHGRVFLDSPVVDGAPTCECNTCYVGADCSELSPNCSADVGSGDPVFLEPYWQKHAASSAVLVSGWHRMSYKATGDNYISVELEKHIRLLHAAVGNAVTDDMFIVFGTGSTQLINALVRALSPDNTSSSSPARVVASIPFYPEYELQTDFFDSREYEWEEGAASDFANASNGNFIEFVTSPNNPDSLLRRSVLGGSSVIYDHCYYWPHYTAIPAPADGDVMLFSNSKISGHASSRFGWALIKDKRVYERATKYIELNSMGVSRDSQLRILKVMKAMLAEMKGEEGVFEFGYATMRERWRRLSSLVSSSNLFSLQRLSPQYCTYFRKIRDPSPAYGWLKCEMEQHRDCEAFLRSEGVITRGGAIFHSDSRYTRLSLIKTQDDFELLMLKMEALINKETSHTSF
ncbi:alliin lyase-like [Iris pallida]|uniref:Alliin lyase-like n=1 Tax=Iris pallida TaxID=29817 RepID=A0AAX6DSK2_IRIPA|nr:alliin lyase-like [Iris pallida]